MGGPADGAGPCIWDFAAGLLLVTEAGGVTRDFKKPRGGARLRNSCAGRDEMWAADGACGGAVPRRGLATARDPTQPPEMAEAACPHCVCARQERRWI
jgi:hypothetical protein